MSEKEKYVMRTYISGRTVEKVVFKAGANVKLRKKRTKGSTPQRKQESNFRSAVKRLARLINCNFLHGDLWVTLTYADKYLCGTFEEAEHQLELFRDRMRRKLKKLDIEFPYICVTSDIDGSTGEVARVHHHIIMPRVSYELIAECWKYGTVDYQILKDQADYTPLAVYLLNQAKKQPDARKYKPSRNLKQPTVKEEFVSDIEKEIKVPKKAVVMHRAEYDKSVNTQYVRYVMPKGEDEDALVRRRAKSISRSEQKARSSKSIAAGSGKKASKQAKRY